MLISTPLFVNNFYWYHSMSLDDAIGGLIGLNETKAADDLQGNLWRKDDRKILGEY